MSIHSRTLGRVVAALAAASLGLVAVGIGIAPAYAADGRSLPTDSALYALSCDLAVPNPQLFSVDAATAAATAIGTPTAEDNPCARQAAWNPVNSTAYFVNSGQVDELATVNLVTGVSSIIAPFTVDGVEEGVDSLAIGLDGAAFAVSGTELVSVDLGTGELTDVGLHGIDGLYGFAVDPTTGGFFAINTEGLFYSVDVTTGAATLVGDTGLTSIDFNLPWSLQIDSAGILWIEAYSFEGETGFLSNLWSIDPADLTDSAVLSGAIASDQGILLTESLLFVPAPVVPVIPAEPVVPVTPDEPVVEPAAAAVPVVPQLANTGVEVAPIAAGGALVALLGVAMLVPAIRRRSASA